MADLELLVRAFSSTHEDPVKNERGCYKLGDIVDVREADFQWGLSERLPKFYRVKITGTPYTVEEAKALLMKSDMDTTDPQKPVLLRRRLHHVNFDTLPQTVKNNLTANEGRITVTFAAVRNYVRNKKLDTTL